MDQHALEYYSSYSDSHAHGNFHHVVALHDEAFLSWEEVVKLKTTICRGWYELAHLSSVDRIEFIREFWLSKLPIPPELQDKFIQFFETLDDIGIFLTQKTYDSPYEAVLVYSLANNSGFFSGHCAATEDEINALQKLFPNYTLPLDYVAFLQIHNGFAKLTDTGILATSQVQQSYFALQKILDSQDPLMDAKGVLINPRALIPFYESFGMPFFQCFFAEWYLEQTMGNVYYSGITHTISPTNQTNDCIETLAFESFIRWLVFYIEKID